MFSEMFNELWSHGIILKGIWETIYMTFLSTAIAYVIGLPLGVVLNVTSSNGLSPNIVLPVRGGDGDDLAAALFALLRRVDRRRIDADIVEEENDIPLLHVIVLHDGGSEDQGVCKYC